jgi:deoxyribodipyrimidine photo-lyase
MTDATTKIPSRSEGLKLLAEFVPRSGKAYRDLAEYDFGPQRRDNVSGLSAYLRCRLLSESEVAEAVLAQQSPADAETFLKELLWRTYWRGWLEGRPQVHLLYRRTLPDDARRFMGTNAYSAALEGRTGLTAFDAWNRELIETGYLHNMARKAYASIWIFTLRLPWTLGAAHFQQHLIDGDPASNTLGWRWVAGLHNPGKHFLAKGETIAKFSDGRFDLKGRLNESALALTGPVVPPAQLLALPQAPSELLGDRYALLVTPDDLSPELARTGADRPQRIVLCGMEALNGTYAFSQKVRDFVAGGLEDARERLARAYGCPIIDLPLGENLGALLGQRLTEEGIPHLVYMQPGVGPWQELLSTLTAKDVGLRYFPLRRAWDARFFPLAQKTYVQFQKAALPLLLKTRGRSEKFS